MLSQTLFTQKEKESKSDKIIYYPVSEYPENHWALQFPKETDENFIAILQINKVLIHIKLNPSDARGYRTIVTIVDKDMKSTLNRSYTSTEQRALQLALGIVAEAYGNARCPIVQQQVAGNNSQSLTKEGIVQIGNAKEPNMLHGHIIVRGNPKEAYIGNVILNGPEPNILFNMRGDGAEEGNKSKLKWNLGEMNAIAPVILEHIKSIAKELNIEIVAERKPAEKPQLSLL